MRAPAWGVVNETTLDIIGYAYSLKPPITPNLNTCDAPDKKM